MKRCARCDIVFDSDDRKQCLYCNDLLASVDPQRVEEFAADAVHSGFAADDKVIRQVIQDRKAVAYDRKYHVVGSYFCSRTFSFMYGFSRNEMRMGRDYRRILVQPLTTMSFLMLPWVVINLMDSLFFRLFYNGYCEQCGWKYTKSLIRLGHDPKECAYNEEYSAIIRDILSGKIGKTENRFRESSERKVAAGERSAFVDLCKNRSRFLWFLDVLCVWFSIAVLLGGISCFAFPLIASWLHGEETINPLGLR